MLGTSDAGAPSTTGGDGVGSKHHRSASVDLVGPRRWQAKLREKKSRNRNRCGVLAPRPVSGR